MFSDTLPKSPDTLTTRGYTRSEDNHDPFGAGVSKVWFTKRIDRPSDSDWAIYSFNDSVSLEMEFVFDIIIQYELSVSDAPQATWDQNCSYLFEEVVLKIWKREQAESEDNEVEQNQIEKLIFASQQTLRPRTFRALESFAEVLGYKPS